MNFTFNINPDDSDFGSSGSSEEEMMIEVIDGSTEELHQVSVNFEQSTTLMDTFDDLMSIHGKNYKHIPSSIKWRLGLFLKYHTNRIQKTSTSYHSWL